MLRLLLTIDTDRDFGDDLDEIAGRILEALDDTGGVRIQVTDETARLYYLLVDQITWRRYGVHLHQQEGLDL
jgi:hypothetical protein